MNECDVCKCTLPWHNCVCGRQCRDESVLIGHIQRQIERAEDRRMLAPPCASDPHQFVRATRTNADRRAHAHIELDVLDDEPVVDAGDFCDKCREPFEIDAALRLQHEQAHKHNKMWCCVCQKAFRSKDSSVLRHMNSTAHGKLAKLRRAEDLGSLPAKRSRTLSQRREITQSYAAAGSAARASVSVSGGAASSDDEDDNGAEFGGGFEGDIDQMQHPGAHEAARAGDGAVDASADNADDLAAHEKKDDVEHDSDDESSVAAEPAPASPMRATLFQSFVPAPPPSRSALVDADIVTFNVPVANNSDDNEPSCNDLTYQLVALAATSGWARESCRRLFKLLHGHKVDVASTYESACVQAATRDASTHVRADLLSVDVPMLPDFPRADNDDRVTAPVTFRSPIKVLVSAILANHRAQQQKAGVAPLSLADSIRAPTATERAAGAAAFAAYHNNGQPIEDIAQVPALAPTSVWSSAAMFESMSAFSVPLAQPATRFVGVSVNFDGTFLYRKQQGCVLRLRFTSDETGTFHEICTWADDQFSVQHICELILIPLARALTAGVRIRRGADSVTLVGCLFDFALDKLAALDMLLVTGKGSALLTPAAAQSAEFRLAPFCDAGEGEQRVVGWRSHSRMKDEQLAAISKPNVTGARDHLRQYGSKPFEVGAKATLPFFALPELAPLLRSGLRVWACYLHQSPLGLIPHFLLRIARSLSKAQVLELNAHLRNAPRVHVIEHLNGDLYRFSSSIKGEYYNTSLCTSSGVQKVHYAYQLVPILDHMGLTAFADALSLYLCADTLMCAGKTAEALRALRDELLPAIRRAPFRLPPSARFAGAASADESALGEMRVRFFVELPKWADWTLMHVANNYCGDLWWTTTAGAEYAHQETKDSFKNHSALTVERGNVSSLNRAERRAAASHGWVQALEAIAAQRQRNSAVRTLLSFVHAESLLVERENVPRALVADTVAAFGERICVLDARIGRLRVQSAASSNSFILDSSCPSAPTFLFITDTSSGNSPVMVELIRAWQVRYSATAGARRILEALFLQVQRFESRADESGEGIWRPYDRLQPVGSDYFVLATDIRSAQLSFVVKHLLNRAVLRVALDPSNE